MHHAHPSVRHALKVCLLAFAGGLCAAGNAQVIRCTDPATGSVSYTDGECAKGQDRKEVAPRQTPEDIQRQYEQAEEALRLRRERQQTEAQAQAMPPAARQEAPDPAQSAQCRQARAALQSAMALDPTLYDTGNRIFEAQQNADLACLTPAEYARSPHRLNGTPPAYTMPPLVIGPAQRPRPRQRAERKPDIVQCDVFRCYDSKGGRYPR